MTNPIVLRERLADPTTRIAAAIEIGDWARNLCLLMGTEFSTACKVGAVFAMGIERSWSNETKEPSK